jgi:hypothetical protein
MGSFSVCCTRSSLDGDSTANGETDLGVVLDGQRVSVNGNDDAVTKDGGKAPHVLPVWLSESTPNEFTVCSLFFHVNVSLFTFECNTDSIHLSCALFMSWVHSRIMQSCTSQSASHGACPLTLQYSTNQLHKVVKCTVSTVDLGLNLLDCVG